MVLVIDNYDSFVHNLARYVRLCGLQTHVVRHDEITIAQIKQLAPSHIILSPGPGTPQGAGICVETVTEFAATIPILGVCLGHQVIAQAFGAQVLPTPRVMHGKSSLIHHGQSSIFENIPSPAQVGRYHSLLVEKVAFPHTFEVIAETEQGDIMAIRHREFPCIGVQFHPESILTEHGLLLLQNFFACYHSAPNSPVVN